MPNSSDEEMMNIEIEVELCCYSDDKEDDDAEEVVEVEVEVGSFLSPSCDSEFYSATYNSSGGGMSRRVSFSDSCSVDDLHLMLQVDNPNPNPNPNNNKMTMMINSTSGSIEERECRICHMSLEEDAIELGCCCKDDLAAAHKHCALTWFQIKGNKTCEICNSTVTNLVIPNEMTTSHATIDMNHPAATSVATSHISTTRGGRGCINGHRLLNFILACLVFAFVISWLFHFNIPS